MRSIILAASASLIAATALAQTAPSNPAPAQPGNVAGASQPAPSAANAASTPNAVSTATPAPQPVAPQAVAPPTTAPQTAANGAARPEPGANSFTQGQARQRIENSGYTQVSNLKRDRQGIWHGRAMKNGQRVNVWLDFKGDVGQS